MKKILCVMLALILTLSVVGCGGSGSTSSTAPGSEASGSEAPSKEKVTLVYWPMWAETEPQGMVIAEAVDAFTEKTGIEVDINWAGGRDTRKTLQPALDAGETIDIFDEDIERVNITWGKYLLDIQGMYDASALNGTQNATLINLAKELGNGSLKTVPYQPSTFLMMYNKAAFDKAGVTASPASWDEFMAA